MLGNCLIFTITVLSLNLVRAYVPDKIATLNLSEVAISAIEYSFDDQVNSSIDKNFLKGEFRTRIKSTLVPALVGVGKVIGHDYEASAFTTSSVVNLLSQIYLDNKNLSQNVTFKKIPRIIDDAVATYSRYKEGDTYNFYPSKTLEDGTVVRRPIDMTLFPLWHGFTNIPNDSDTTSAVITSLYYQAKIQTKSLSLPVAAIEQITAHLDNNRNPMYYNRFENRKKTGAFMTWLMDEKDPKMPRFIFADSEAGQRIPFNKNDVDCIVNMNVLKMLTMAEKDQPSTPGYDSTCQMINDMVEKNEESSCGIYYPNTYNLSFALASASKAGNRCLKAKNNDLIVQRLITEQTADGSWVNIKNIWQDPVLSSAFAVSALLELGDLNSLDVRRAVFYGIHFLLLNAKLEKKSKIIYWEEENFFTATAIARSLIMWKSKAYTNLIIAGVLLKMHSIYPSYNVENYIKLNL